MVAGPFRGGRARSPPPRTRGRLAALAGSADPRCAYFSPGAIPPPPVPGFPGASGGERLPVHLEEDLVHEDVGLRAGGALLDLGDDDAGRVLDEVEGRPHLVGQLLDREAGARVLRLAGALRVAGSLLDRRRKGLDAP